MSASIYGLWAIASELKDLTDTTCPYDGLYSTRKDVIFSKKESLIDEGENEDEDEAG